MGDRYKNFEDPMFFLTALYIVFIFNFLIPGFLDTLYSPVPKLSWILGEEGVVIGE